MRVMRDMRKRLFTSILVLSFFLVSMTWVPTVPHWGTESSDSESQTGASPIIQDTDDLTPIDDLFPEEVNQYNVADIAPADGVLDPASIEQTGYLSSGNQTALTDRNPNVGYDFPIDDAHDWMGSSAEVDVWNLTKTFVSNGTFDEGISGINEGFASEAQFYPFGWNTWGNYSDPDTIQRTGYIEEDRKYILMEDEGDPIGTGVNLRFQHGAGTIIQFNQTISNTPYTENFVFSLDYVYVRGPLGLSVGENISLVARADGNVIWSTNLADLSNRNQWYSTGQIAFNHIGINDTFVFQIALEIPYNLQIYAVDHTFINSAYFTVHVDDVIFDGASTPGFDEVDLQFEAGAGTTPIVGTAGTGSVSILNASFWRTAPLSTSILANTTVSYNYRIRLKTHRFTNASWTTDTGLEGTSYSVLLGDSSLLSFYAYLGFLGDYEELTQIFRFPSDWANVSVLDPFKTPVTGSCSVSVGQIVIPTSILDRLGWWEVKLESPNYAKSIKSQKFDGSWTEVVPPIFRISNTTRADITIGTETQILGSLTGVNATWFNSTGGVWATDSLTGGALGQIFSSSHTFNPGSSPAGEWWVEVYWTNGTEVAYDRTRFEVHHSALLSGDPAEISADTGVIVTGLVRYSDIDTGVYLMDGVATLVANWSGGDVTFVANSIQNWWEGDFDTSLSGEGDFVIVVNATRPYYDDVSCEIVVHSMKVTRLNSPNAPWSTAEWGDSVPLTFNFESYNFGTELWGPVVNESDISVSANWTAGYWTIVEDAIPGVFILTLDTSVKDAGTWLLNTTFSKPHHESKTVLLALIVSPTTSSLSILEGISARVDLDESYPLTLRYLDHESTPITSASVIVDNISPSTGLDHTPIVEVGGEPGNYTVSLTPHEAGVYTVRFLSDKTNFENATTVFVLVVNDVATHLDIPGTGSEEIGLTDVFNTTIRFEMFNGTGVPGAQINVTYTGGTVGSLSWGLVDIGLGDYSIEFSSTASGTYLVTIAAFKPYHQSDSDAFFLVVRDISTNMTSLNGTADLVSFGKDYRLFISYTNGTGHGLAGANVSVENVVPETGLSWGTTSVEDLGIYSILLTPLESNSFTIVIQATLQNHQTQFVLFTLTSTAIATSLASLNVSTTISLDQTFTVTLLFQDEDVTPIENATITIQNPPIGVEFSAFTDLGNGYYEVTITPLHVGTFDIVFKASKDGYQNGYATITFGATRIPTSLRTSSGLSSDTTTYSDDYELVVLYERLDIAVNISTATIDVQANPSTGFNWSYEETGDGYVITITPGRTGRWTFTISAQLGGHASSFTEFILSANPIQVSVEITSSLLVVEGTDFDVTVQLSEQDSSEPVTDALVSFRLTPVGSSGAGEFIELLETSTPGQYSSIYMIPLYLETTQYTLEIKVEKDNYVLLGEVFERPFVKDNDDILRLTPFINGGSVLAIVFVAVLVGVRVNTKRKKAQIAIDISNKRRFDDADNIIGVIVMHKSSGIPIYSRIVKGGFEEGIVAAFISAVTHFREEFEMFDEETIRVIPISDIIRAVQTRNLICAFITVRSASIEHNRKMELYAMQVGTYLDDLYESLRPSSMLDEKVTEMLDYIYESTMDGLLVRFYKLATSEKFPRRYRHLESVLIDTDTKHCSKPILLSKSVSKFGDTEARGCTLVLEAIDKELIVLCEDHETVIPEFDFEDFFKERNGNAGNK
jgi:hypothetical protein